MITPDVGWYQAFIFRRRATMPMGLLFLEGGGSELSINVLH